MYKKTSECEKKKEQWAQNQDATGHKHDEATFIPTCCLHNRSHTRMRQDADPTDTKNLLGTFF